MQECDFLTSGSTFARSSAYRGASQLHVARRNINNSELYFFSSTTITDLSLLRKVFLRPVSLSFYSKFKKILTKHYSRDPTFKIIVGWNILRAS